MVTANTPDQELPLSTPLACWHESLHAARHDAIVALSARRARIASERPVPAGMPVFIELGPDAGIDAVAVEADADTFLVEFITVDDNAASVLGAARRAGEVPPPTNPVAVPRVRTDELLLAAPAGMSTTAAAPVPIAAPPVDPVVATTDGPSERTGEFLTSGLIEAPAEEPIAADVRGDGASLRTGEFFVSSFIDTPAQEATAATGDDAVIRTGEFLAVDPATPAPASVDAALPTDAFAADPVGQTDTDGAGPGRSAADDDVPDAGVAAVGAASASSGPAWARALDADLGDEPEGSEVDHTQRWPTARLASSEPDAAAAPLPPAAADETERWPAARVTVQPAADPASNVAPVAPPLPAAVSTTTATATAVARAVPAADDDETTRWPAARAVVVAPTTTPAVASTPTAAPTMSLDEGEDVVLEFTAPQRPAAGLPRPLPPPEPDGVVEVDFSEFKDVLGVATFRADGGLPRPLAANRVTTPAPISISLPRTPSSSLQPVMEARNPFAGDSGVGPRPDSTPPIVTPGAGAAAGGERPDAVDEQWVVSSPSLPAPRLLDRGLDRVLRSGGGPNSATPKPLPFHDSTPSSPPLPVPSAPPTMPAPIAVPATTTAPATAAPTMTPAEPLAPRVVPAARSPFAVPPVSPVVAPRPPAVVPVVVPPRPMVPVSLPPRPVAAIPVAPPPVTATPTAVLSPTTPRPLPTSTPATRTPAEPFPGSARVLPVTPSAEGLPVIVGSGDGDET